MDEELKNRVVALELIVADLVTRMPDELVKTLLRDVESPLRRSGPGSLHLFDQITRKSKRG